MDISVYSFKQALLVTGETVKRWLTPNISLFGIPPTQRIVVGVLMALSVLWGGSYLLSLASWESWWRFPLFMTIVTVFVLTVFYTMLAVGAKMDEK